ncbi:MAG: hypothetical protein D6776_02855 [Planctomycetota bacterium]|nr:MAG: hypothetical protein D6776_02855 [Planctomycetota bacterium]
MRAGADGPARKLAEGAVHGAAAGALVGGLAQIGPQGLLLGSLTGWWGPLGLLAGGALLGAATGMWAGWHGRID